MAEFKDRLNQALLMKDIKPAELAKLTGIGEGAISHTVKVHTRHHKGTWKRFQRHSPFPFLGLWG